MNYNFFATSPDKIRVLDFIFTQTDLQVFDLYSEPGQEVCQYRNSAEVAEKFDLENGEKSSVAFQLWCPRFDGKVVFIKIDLNPKYCDGHTYRYRTDGWGLIQLCFGGQQQNRLHHSHIGHFEEKGAAKWEDLGQEKSLANQWNWKEVKATSGMVRRQIQKMSVRKIGSCGVMQGADDLGKARLTLR